MKTKCRCVHKPEQFDCGHDTHTSCYCNEDQGCGYTFDDEYGPCDFCLGLFEEGQRVGNDKHNQPVVCTCQKNIHKL